MAALTQLLYQVHLTATAGDMQVDVKSVTADSRQVVPGSVFVAVRGRNSDGHAFIAQAIAAGASAIVAEHDTDPESVGGVTWVTVTDSAQALGIMAAAFHGHPSRRLRLVGVTGTNGKTTVATLLHKLYSGMDFRCGLLSTVVNRIVDNEIPSTHTTPDPVQLQSLLAQMVDAGCTHCFMEVSSHAVDQRRISGLEFYGAIFTNITHDHLDYHGTFDHYIKAKKGFFDALPSSAFALVNADDKRGAVMLQNCRGRRLTFSTQRHADYRARIMANTMDGLELDINGRVVWFRLVGDFNAYNLLAVYGAACELGQSEEQVLTVLSALTGAVGRFERVMPGFRFTAIVDYAHTPDALQNVLETIGRFRTGQEQVICVVGCGGDRDRTKRPVMASIACKFSDVVILTSDNPRSEDPMAIIREMQSGVLPTDARKVLVQPDRAEAIRTACVMARDKDVVLVAGKGHEQYQEIAGVRHPFDDREVLERTMKTLA